MEIRQLQEQDGEKYLQIRLEALQTNPGSFATTYEEEKKYPVEKYENRFKLDDQSFTFGAFDGDKLIGVVTLVREKITKFRHRANLVAMYVSPEKRGQGIGKALVEAAVAKAKTIDGLEQLYLMVVSSNEAAIGMYSSIGFEAYALEKRALKYDGAYLDEYRMVLFI